MSILTKVSEYKDSVMLFLAVTGVGVTLLNLVILNSLSPVLTHLQKLDTQVEAIDKTSQTMIDTLATKEQVGTLSSETTQRDNDIIHRLDIISSRLDGLINR